MKIKIEKLERTTREGQYGPYVTMSIRAGGKYYSSFEKDWNRHWQAGMEVDAEVEQKGKYLNLVKPSDAPPTVALPTTGERPKSGSNAEVMAVLWQIVDALVELKQIVQSGGVRHVDSTSRPSASLPAPPVEDEAGAPFDANGRTVFFY